LAEPRIEGDHFEHLDGFEFEFGGDPVDGSGGDETEPLLTRCSNGSVAERFTG
jgi:hypothetical protein